MNLTIIITSIIYQTSTMNNNQVTLIINNNQYIFNKDILIIKSNFFEDKFKNNNTLKLNLSSYQEQILIQYLNNQKYNFDENHISEMFELTEVFQISSFSKKCNSYFTKKINYRIKSKKLEELFEYCIKIINTYPQIYKTVINRLATKLKEMCSPIHDYREDFGFLYNAEESKKSEETFNKYKVLLKLPSEYFVDIVNNKKRNYNGQQLLNFCLKYLGIHFYKNTNDPLLFETFDKIKDRLFDPLELSKFNHIYSWMHSKTPFAKKYKKYFERLVYNHVFL